ncbi:hypothetical protein [Clostridium perfringens]|nr:hypothetical protein [Clostridium perfringens]
MDSLGAEYLGINGLLTNVLSAMVLIEGGIGISIVYNLYTPLAENNKPEIIALVQLYKKAYRVLAFIVLVISLFLFVMIDKIIDVKISGFEVFIVYFIFVGKNIISYLNAYKWSLINADQKGYILTKNNIIFESLTVILKIIILILTKSYILFLLIELSVFILQNLINSKFVYKLYPYLKDNNKYEINKETKKNIIKNVKAMFIQNIGYYAINSTDNIIISIFVSIKYVGLYSNYSMIIGQAQSLLSQFISGVGHSVGNLIATDKDKSYGIFKVLYLITFWIYSFFVIFLYNLLEPFITWWLGGEYIINKFTLMVILINFYIVGTSELINTFKKKSGLFSQDKYIVVIEGLLNLVLSIILVKRLGLVGVFLGTTISMITTQFWNRPRITYKYLFKKRLSEYFKLYILYSIIAIISCLLTTYICNEFINGSSFLSLIYRGIICLLSVNIFYVLIFFRTKEFRYIVNSILSLKINFKNKVKK